MRAELGELIYRLAMEPPFRIVARALLKRLSVSIDTRDRWELTTRPQYLLGVHAAARQALRQGVPEISAIEFGVAGGEGLVALEREAEAVERATGVKIRVYGFDTGGAGLPALIGDYRDHPDAWQHGDFPMDEEALRSKLTSRTTLVLGNVNDTVPRFFADHDAPPIGFASIDVDLYSSSRDALRIFNAEGARMLWHTALYFDDIHFFFNHRWAGEFLAVREFNERNESIKIDRWYGVRSGRPFPERAYLDQMFVAHDLEGASSAVLERDVAVLPVSR